MQSGVGREGEKRKNLPKSGKIYSTANCNGKKYFGDKFLITEI